MGRWVTLLAGCIRDLPRNEPEEVNTIYQMHRTAFLVALLFMLFMLPEGCRPLQASRRAGTMTPLRWQDNGVFYDTVGTGRRSTESQAALATKMTDAKPKYPLVVPAVQAVPSKDEARSQCSEAPGERQQSGLAVGRHGTIFAAGLHRLSVRHRQTGHTSRTGGIIWRSGFWSWQVG